MSQPVHKKKFGSEFLCKTRYRNTLPLPPFAPKLLALPSSTERCIKFQSTGLNESTANEMILDNQLAIPIDLIEMRENYFGEGRQHHHENGSLANGALNQVDEMLLTVPLKAAPGTPAANGVIAGGSSAGLIVPNKHRLPVVSWLRRTEYISSETPTGAGKGAYKETNVGRKKNMVVDNSREGQIAAIEKTFERFSKVSEEKFLAGLRHPTNPGLTAVESLPVFPDFSIWGNDYTLVTFDVDPEMTNQRSKSQDEGNRAQRSSNALIKPMHNANDPETWLAYYLPDMDTAKEINHRKRSRAQLAASGLSADDDEDSKEISFSLQRDYTYTTIPCASLSQLVFTFRDDVETKQKAAFYNPMQSKLMLRKKRAKRYEDDDPPITHIDVTSRRMNSDELAAKRDALEAIGL